MFGWMVEKERCLLPRFPLIQVGTRANEMRIEIAEPQTNHDDEHEDRSVHLKKEEYSC